MATGALTETVAEEVAQELEHAAVVTRRIDGRVAGSFLIGVGVGIAAGFYIGYRYSKKKLRVEIYEEAEKEINDIRDLYQAKLLSAEAQMKPSVETIIKDRGYDEIVDEARPEYLDEPAARPTTPPVPVHDPRPPIKDLPTPIDPSRRVYRTEDAQKDKNEGWNIPIEMARRRPDIPHIIHQDEYLLNESGYQQVTYVYYELDDVLVDEDDVQTILNNRENLIGTEALRRFGHGADDYNLVHVRNPELQLEFVINRVEESWEEEVLGLDRDDSS